MTERFKKAFNALTRAYFEGTLAKGTCVACACGNIIFDAVADPVTKKDIEEEFRARFTEKVGKSELAGPLWADKRVGGIIDSKFKFIAKYDYIGEINAAGYTAEEFAEIENAFEENTKIRLWDYFNVEEQKVLEDQYNGLCAVVDVLMELDKETEGAEEYKQQFRKHPKLATV